MDLDGAADGVEDHRTEGVEARGECAHRKVLDGRFERLGTVVQRDQGVQRQRRRLQADEDENQVVRRDHELEARDHEQKQREILRVVVLVETLGRQGQRDEEHRRADDDQLREDGQPVHQHHVEKAEGRAVLHEKARKIDQRAEVDQQEQQRHHDVKRLVQARFRQVDHQDGQRAGDGDQHWRQGLQLQIPDGYIDRFQHYSASLCTSTSTSISDVIAICCAAGFGIAAFASGVTAFSCISCTMDVTELLIGSSTGFG